MSQKWYISHAETITQNVLGLIISFIILRSFGMTTNESIHLQAVFFVVSYIRSYCIRRFFDNLNNRKKGEIHE